MNASFKAIGGMGALLFCTVLPLGCPAAGVDLHALIRHNDLPAVKAAVTGNTNLVFAATEEAVTALHTAAVLDREDIVSILISRGAVVDARTLSGFTPLHWAASRDAAGAAGRLLESGAAPNAESPHGITPLHWAALNNATNVIQLLVAAGASLDIPTDSGHTPLHWAVMRNANEAALLIAFQVVSAEMDRQTSSVPPAAEVTEPDTNAVLSPAAEPDLSVRPAVGSFLIVPLGQGTTMEFIWLASLGMWSGKYEVTNGQYRRFDPKHRSPPRDAHGFDGDDQPVVCVTWHEARAFCDWLNRLFEYRLPKGCEFKLPTSAEWISIAKCGDSRAYPWGSDWPPRYGNYSDLSAKAAFADWAGIIGYDDGHAVTCPVSASGTNEWGVYGLAGNVWEWCQDWHAAAKEYKIRHGASWEFDGEPAMRIATLGFDRPDASYDTIGFRVVVVQKGQNATEITGEPPLPPAGPEP